MNSKYHYSPKIKRIFLRTLLNIKAKNIQKGIPNASTIVVYPWTPFRNALEKIQRVNLDRNYLPIALDTNLYHPGRKLRDRETFKIFCLSRFICIAYEFNLRSGAFKNQQLLVHGFNEFFKTLDSHARQKGELIFIKRNQNFNLDENLITNLIS
jgi:hypothetical protein